MSDLIGKVSDTLSKIAGHIFFLSADLSLKGTKFSETQSLHKFLDVLNHLNVI